MYTREEVYNASLKYFNGDELATDVWIGKYCLTDNKGNCLEKSPEDMHWRLANEFARIEAKKFKKPLSAREIFDLFDHFKYIIPQGSPMYGIGNPYQYVSLGNCFVIPSPLDSYLGIMYTDTQITQITCRRGGVGWDISLLRPVGTTVTNAAKTTSGTIEFAKRFSNTIREVGQNGRRGASLQSMLCYHPEILNFIKVKKDLKTLTGSNITIQFTDEFMEAVDKDEEISLRWPCTENHAKILNKPIGYINQNIKARIIWKEFIDSAWEMAEPGCCFIDTVHRDSPGYPYGHIEISSNPCGEQYLPAYASCRLIVLNLLSFVKNPFTKQAAFDFNDFKEKAILIQRLADDMVDLELECIDRIIDKIKSDPEPEYIKAPGLDLWHNIKQTAIEDRRTGCGFTALGDTLAALNLPYLSKKSIEFAELMQKTYALSAYRSSVDMAKELGSFPCFDPKLDVKSGFIQKIKDEDPILFEDMQKYGRRNMVLLTVAPTGSVSCLTQTTSGIEPVFRLSYTRRKKGNPGDKDFKSDFIDQNGDHWQHYEVYHKGFTDWQKVSKKNNIEESPYYKSTAMDLDWLKRIEMQSVIQKWIDNSVSVTINLPSDVSKEIVSNIYFSAWKLGCKGVTVYREGSRSGVLIENDNAKKSFIPNDAPKRPNSLPCNIHMITAKGERFAIVVGLLEGNPYEVFAHHVPKYFRYNISQGFTVKYGSGQYALEDENGNTIVSGLGSREHMSDEEAALTRMISMSLRHGANIKFVIDQLNKIEGNITSLCKAIARTLKEYSPTSIESGGNCPICNSLNYINENGCFTCKDCGYSKCS